MEAVQTVEHPTFETVWAALQENDRQIKQRAEEWEKRHKESTEEWEKRHKESNEEWEKWRKESNEEWEKRHKKSAEDWEETKRRMDESAARLDRQLGKLGNRFGEMVEYMVMPNLVKKFREMGFGFTEAYPHSVIEDRENNIFTEVDITLRNGEEVMIVEVKSKPTTEDITDHVQRLEKIQLHSRLHGHKQRFYAAVAGMVFNENEKTFALKNGFYVIEPSGETFTVTVPEGIYSVKHWG
jgi:hypothetical protein